MKYLDTVAVLAATLVGGYFIISYADSPSLKAESSIADFQPVEQVASLSITEQYQNDCIGDVEKARAENIEMIFASYNTPEKSCRCTLDHMKKNGVKEDELFIFWGDDYDFGNSARMIDFSKKRKRPSMAETQRKAKALGKDRFIEISKIAFSYADCMKPSNWDALHEQRRAAKR